MWWWALAVLALADTLTSQVTNEDDRYRQAREKLGIDCCPCPGSQTLDSGLPSTAGQSVAATDFRLVNDLPQDVQSRVDCPCKLQGDDSQGSSSIFVPRMLHPLRPDLTPSISKQEPKPLMEPEVKLASSVLDTLKEATDEDYQDAIARDVIRGVDSDLEVLLDNSTSDDGNKVLSKFASNDEEDTLVPEATHVQESRCPHPSQSTFKLGKVQSKPLLGSHKYESKNLFRGSDLHSAANNIIENILGLNKDLETLQLKTSPSILNLFPGGLKPILGRNTGNNVMRIPQLNRMTYKNVEDENCEESDRRLDSSKIPNFKLSSTLSTLSSLDNPTNDRNREFSKLRSTAIPSFRSQLVNDMDTDVSPSNVNEHFTDVDFDDSHSKFQFKSPLRNLKLRPLRLSKLLNLKDVELLPPGLRKVTKVNIPSLPLPPIAPREKLQRENIVNNSDDFDESQQVITDSKENDMTTKILDVVPSPSENKAITHPATNTQILDTLPNVSQPLNNVPHVKGSKGDKINMSEVSTIQNNLQNVTVNSNSKDLKKRVELVDPLNINEEAIIFDDSDSNTIIIIDENGQTTTFENLDDNSNNLSNDSDEEIVLDDFEDSDETDIDPETIITNGLPLDSEVDTTNNDFQFALPTETEDDFAENFAEEESRSQLTPAEPSSVSAPTIVSDTLQKIKERLDEIKAKLAVNRSNQNDKNSRDFKQSENSDKTILDTKISKDCGCNIEKTDPTTTTAIDDSKSESIKEANQKLKVSNQSCNIGLKEAMDSKTNELEGFSPLDIKDVGTQSNNLFEQCCKNDNKPTRQNQNKHRPLEKSEEDNDTNETNSTEDQDEVPETSTIMPELSTTEATEQVSDNTPSNTLQQNNNSIVSRPDADTNTQHRTNVENLCKISSPHQEKTQLKNDDDQVSEMSVGGSAPEPNIAPLPSLPSLAPTLFNNGIVQPSSLINNDIFNRPIPGLGDLFNFNTRLPTLDVVRSEIANALGIESRNAGKLETMNYEPDDETFNPTMFSDASTNRAKSVLPSLRPLEDLNLDIFQVRPLSQARFPGLDLNSFKTHLALPKNLGLRPVKLQSSLRRNGGLLGATLTFGPEKTAASRKSSSFAPFESKILSSTPSLNIPSLSELRDKMRANAEDLLSSSPFTISKIPIPTAPSLGAIHENLRTHTENTMRNLQQTLASTLNEARTKQEKYARPKDALEDFHEKLQALHMDFNDRLTSIHERIFDKSILPDLLLPRVHETRNVRPTKPIKASNFRVNKPQSSKIKEQRNLKKFQISKAASTLMPKNVEVPKLIPTSSVKPPVFKILQQDKSPNFEEIKSKARTADSNNKQSFRDQYKQNRENNLKSATYTEQKFKDNFERATENIRNNLQSIGSRRKLKDSHGFASELSQAVIPAPNQQQSKINKLQDISLNRIKPQINLPKLSTVKTLPKLAEDSNKPLDLFARKPSLSKRPKLFKSQNQAIDDSIGFPSENNPKDLLKIATPPKPFSIKTPKTKFSKPTVPVNSEPKSLTPIGQRLPSDTLKPKLLKDLRKETTLVRTTESPFLTRVRESLKSRVSTLNKSKPKTVIGSQIPLGNDMTISATENREIAVLDAQPLKENVQYKCKMICVREPTK